MPVSIAEVGNAVPKAVRIGLSAAQACPRGGRRLRRTTAAVGRP